MFKLRNITKVIMVIFLTMILSGCGSAVAQHDIMERLNDQSESVITWGVKVDTKLFGYYNIVDQVIEGFDIDIAKALTEIITDGEGTAEFVEVTSKTRIPLLKNGNIDAIIATMTISDERLEVVDFSEIYFDAGQSLLVHQDSNIEGIDSLTSDHTVIAIKGSTSAQNIRELVPEVNVIEMENYSEGFVALQSNQGDALTTDNAILLGMISENPNYRLAGENFTAEPYGIAVDKSQGALKEAINAALNEIIENGTYEEIYQKWFEGLIDLEEE